MVVVDGDYQKRNRKTRDCSEWCSLTEVSDAYNILNDIETEVQKIVNEDGKDD